jgi:hypothetical protein
VEADRVHISLVAPERLDAALKQTESQDHGIPVPSLQIRAVLPDSGVHRYFAQI